MRSIEDVALEEADKIRERGYGSLGVDFNRVEETIDNQDSDDPWPGSRLGVLAAYRLLNELAEQIADLRQEVTILRGRNRMG